MDTSLIASVAAVAASILSLLVALLRKKSHVVADLEEDLRVTANEAARLGKELAQARADLHAATTKLGPEVLTAYAKQAVAYAEQLGGTSEEKLRHAVGAAQRLDAGDNGKRDWSDAQIRIAIEAELNRASR